MPTAIAYIRVSGKRQVAEGNSLAIQRQQAESYARQKGYALARIFEERGESAKTDDRTALKEMIAYCKAHPKMIEVLIFPKIDRLARDSHDYATIKVSMLRLGIRFESIGENFDSSPAGRFSENVLVAVAQFDNEVRAERCKGGMMQCVAEGRWTWKAPIGYRTVRVNRKGTIEPDPRIAPLIQAFFQKLARGEETLRTAHMWLESQGVAVSQANVYRMIQNKAYLGIIKAFGGEYKAVEPFVPLVDSAVFYRAQDAVARRQAKKTYERDNKDFPLRGTLVCSECGRTLTASWSKGMNNIYAYYRCLGCKQTNLSRSETERAFIAVLNEFRFSEAQLISARESLVKAWAESQKESLEVAERTNFKLIELRDLKRAISLKNAHGIIPDDIAKEEIDRLDKEIGLLSPIESQRLDTQRDFEGAVDRALDFLTNLGRLWEFGTLEFRKRVQRFFYPDGLRYSRSKGFRTDEYKLLEEAKLFIRDSVCSLVDHSEEKIRASLEVTEFLEGVDRLVAWSDSEGS